MKKGNASSTSAGSPPRPAGPDTLSPETLGIVLLAVGGLTAVSLAQATPGVAPFARQVFGWGALPLSVALMVAGVLLLIGRFVKVTWRWLILVGLELLFISLLGLSHLWWSGDDPLSVAQAGAGGGYVGWTISTLLRESLGDGVAALLLLLVGGLGLWYTVSPVGELLLYFAAETWDRLRDVWLPRFDPTGGARLPERAPDVPGLESRVRPDAAPATVRPVASVERSVRAPRPTRSGVPVSSQLEEAPVAAARVPRPKQDRTRTKAAPPAPEPASDDSPLPSLAMLSGDSTQRFGEATVREMANTIEHTLNAFNVPVKVVNVNRGPTVTQFGIEPGFVERAGRRYKIRVSKIERLSDDLALALAAPSLRIEAPVPGRPYVGIEVPNPQSTLVTLRGVLESQPFRKVGTPLALGLGKDVSGTAVAYDLARMPHLLIAGATGSGKSVCINAIVTSLLFNNTPDTLRLLMVDPKMVELSIYNGIPHLLAPVVTAVDEAVAMLTWATLQMDDRYRKFAEVGARNIETYNKKVARRRDVGALPYLVILIDELADLMMTAPDQVERHICRLAQMARATGIHLVLATQRPSVDVVTGLIKANFPARIAFAVTSQIDSRVILDTPGAEKLLGRGDMLFMTADSSKVRRVQGCYVSDREIERVVDFWRKKVPADTHLPVHPWAGLLDQQAEDGHLQDAIDAIRGRKRVSTSLLQRQMRIGYPRAARLMDDLEAKGIVGPDEGGGRSRLVLLEQAVGEEEA